MGNILLSVIVPTRNRETQVLQCLDELETQCLPYDDVEIVVVDNASTDSTRQIVREFISNSKARITYASEPRVSVSMTRNRGRLNARGSVLAYIDDDAIPHPMWISKIRDHFLSSQSDCLAWRIEVKFVGPRPEWFPDNLLWVLGKSRYGLHDRPLTPPEAPQGNFALRSLVFDSLHGFDPTIPYYGEEVDFFYRVMEHGYSSFYRNDVVIDHCVSADRITKIALRRKAFLMGRGYALLRNKGTAGKNRWRWASLDFLRTSRIACAWALDRRFDREFTFHYNLGTLLQTLSLSAGSGAYWI